MTCQELIMKLKQLPADATIVVWDDGYDMVTDEIVVELQDKQILIARDL